MLQRLFSVLGDLLMNTPYSSEFFAEQQSGSIASAQSVVPHVLSLFRISSVLDVGCGVGGWLEVFARNGVVDYLGVDGDYIPLDMLKIPVDRFRALDVGNLPDFGRRFDLVCSLEVAEHLPEAVAGRFIAGLVKAAPVVLFSAAIPHQGGTAHINEQWQAYWAARFAEHGYLPVDCIRPLIYGRPEIEWWYRQNVLIFCPRERCPGGYHPTTDAYDLNRIDPAMIEHLLTPSSGRHALNDIQRVLPYLLRAIVAKIGLSIPRGGRRRLTGS
jgi:SAM-dependent methyltransferase